jgi:hypothetical protein
MSERPPITAPVRLVLRLAAVVGAFSAIQVVAAVIERSFLDGNAAQLIAQDEDPDGMRWWIATLDEGVNLYLFSALLCLAGVLLALFLRRGMPWARVTMMLAFAAGATLYLISMATAAIPLYSGHLWAGPSDPPGSLMLLPWYPPVHYVSSMVDLAGAIALSVLLFREPLKEFVYNHRPEAGSDWDLASVRQRQADRSQ